MSLNNSNNKNPESIYKIIKEFICVPFNFAIICTAIYAVFNLILVLKHEPWRDEAQAWLLCRDLPLSEIFKHTQWEGHPILWNLVLLPFAKLGFPFYPTIGLISTALMSASVFLFCKNSRMPKMVTALCLSGVAFNYFLPIISRNYSLTVFLMVLAGSFYSKRNEFPLPYAISLALLLQTHLVIAGFAGTLMLIFCIEQLFIYYDNRTKPITRLISVVIQPLSIIFLVIQLMGGLEKNTMVGAVNKSFLTRIYNLIEIAEVFLKEILGIDGFGHFVPIFLLPITCLIIVIAFRLTKIFCKEMAVLVVGIGYQLVLYEMLSWQPANQKVTLIVWVFVWVFWMMANSYKDKEILVYDDFTHKAHINTCYLAILLCLVSVSIGSIQMWSNDASMDYYYDYSGAKEMADYINNELPDDCIIIGDMEPYASTVAAFLPKERFYNPIRRDFISYTTWDEKWHILFSFQEVLDLIETDPRLQDKDLYVLICSVTSYNDYRNYTYNSIQLMYSSEGRNQPDESYMLYKINVTH